MFPAIWRSSGSQTFFALHRPRSKRIGFRLVWELTNLNPDSPTPPGSPREAQPPVSGISNTHLQGLPEAFSTPKRLPKRCENATVRSQVSNLIPPPGVLHWTLGSGASACHAEPIPLFAMKLARALAGRPIRALIGVIHLARGKRGCVTPGPPKV